MNSLQEQVGLRRIKQFAMALIVLPFILSAAEGETVPEKGEVVEGAHHYFPDEVGLTWTYRGFVVDDILRVSDYTNVAKILGTDKKGGVEVQVFSETNQGGRGPTESYFKQDKTGITYWGGSPTTDFESRLVPYKVIPFPIVFGEPYRQIERNGVPYETDLDQDGARERADALAEITAVGFETISTPAGHFRNTIKFEGKMTIWITLSKDKTKVVIVSQMTNWFAPGVGMVKGIERVSLPAIGGKPSLESIMTEVLESFSRKESPA
jgi:hypothetical protein